MSAAWRCRLLFIVGMSTITPAEAQKTANVDLGRMDLEDLMNIRVTSVSRREQKLSHTAAAVFVIRHQDIRRSGATSIPDLLRMVPGLDVAQINGNTWAISSRGFNGQFSNKLLVLIDGRTVYDPSFAGVYWSVQDTVLEDIERIEVIRGPGAAIWGSNAVNGVINITTKTARHTTGGLVSGAVGNGEQEGTLRYGGRMGPQAEYRIFAKYFNRAGSAELRELGMTDGYHVSRGGFRADWRISANDSATLQGDFYSGSSGSAARAEPTLEGFLPLQSSHMRLGGGNVLARWSHTFAGGSQLSVQAYFDRMTRVDSKDPELRTTADFDLRDHLMAGRHEVVWGFGYRHNWDRMSGAPAVFFQPVKFQASIVNAFAQDEITLVEDKLWLTLGGKLEHNVYTGVESEPTASLMWTPGERHGFWISAAKATKIPARNNTAIEYILDSLPTPAGPALVKAYGNPQFQSESVRAFEIGYRFEAASRLHLDLTAFRNDYSHVRTLERGSPAFIPGPTPYVLVPMIYGNKMRGSTYGAEGAADWKASSAWMLHAGYAWFLPDLRLDPSSTDTIMLLQNQGNAPRTQFQLRSQLNLPRRFEFDASVYRVGALNYGSIPTYHRLDARIGWRATRRWEVSLVGQNLLAPAHWEFNQNEQTALSRRMERRVFGRLTWHF